MDSNETDTGRNVNETLLVLCCYYYYYYCFCCCCCCCFCRGWWRERDRRKIHTQRVNACECLCMREMLDGINGFPRCVFLGKNQLPYVALLRSGRNSDKLRTFYTTLPEFAECVYPTHWLSETNSPPNENSSSSKEIASTILIYTHSHASKLPLLFISVYVKWLFKTILIKKIFTYTTFSLSLTCNQANIVWKRARMERSSSNEWTSQFMNFVKNKVVLVPFLHIFSTYLLCGLSLLWNSKMNFWRDFGD